MNRHQAADDVVAEIDSVLAETIDGAQDDWAVGPDAMRWSPEPIGQPDAFERARLDPATLARLAECMNVAARQVEDAWTQLTAAMFAVVTPQLTPRPTPRVHVSTMRDHGGMRYQGGWVDEVDWWAWNPPLAGRWSQVTGRVAITRLDCLVPADSRRQRELSAMHTDYATRSRARRRRRK